MGAGLGSNGKGLALLSCDVSEDGFTVVAGSELQGDDAVISYWYAIRVSFTPGSKHGAQGSPETWSPAP